MARSLVALAVLVIGLAAQDPDRLLRDTNPAHRAWGAERAARSGDEKWTPHLLRALAELRRDAGAPAALARRIIAGSLVDLAAIVPEPELRSLVREFPVEAFILMARDPKANVGLVRDLIAEHTDLEVKTAASNLLLEFDRAWLAELLMKDTTLVVTLKVTDDDRAPFLFTVFGGGDSGWSEVPKDFPAVKMREFCDRHAAGAKILVDGPSPVHFAVRTIEPGAGFGLSEISGSTWRDRRVQYLEHLAGVKGLSEFTGSFGMNLVWRGDERFLEAVEKYRTQVESEWRELRDALVAAELLDRSAAAELSVRVSFAVEDHREKKTPVPRILETPSGKDNE